MTRRKFEELVLETYGVKADYPFEGDFETGVFRHENTGKWFALAMRINGGRLGKNSETEIDVVNFKCAPEVIEAIVGVERGVYRAYHMNKTHWLTVSLSECEDGTVSWLLGISYGLTEKKTKKRIKTK